MKLSVSVQINASAEEVWKGITDFENCANYIQGIKSLEILEQPQGTWNGFKWKETRIMFGKEATETMWITNFEENKFYETRAENHGAIYISTMSIEPNENGSTLTMSFAGEAQSLMGKIMSKAMGWMMIKPMKKMLLQDLTDIKNHIEAK